MKRIHWLLLLLTLMVAGCDRLDVRPGPGAISWRDASSHIGQIQAVEGPVVSTKYASSSKGSPTFLNLGRNYPDTARCTILIYGVNRGAFPTAPESAYRGKRVRVTGLIKEYEGATEIIITSPNEIEVLK